MIRWRGSNNFIRELERGYSEYMDCSIGLLRNKWGSLDMNSVIIKDSLNPIMFILYLEARMMACEHMQQLHRASTGLESRVIVIPRFPDWRGIVMTGHARFSFFTVNTRNGATCFVSRTCDAPSCVNDQITMTRWRLESNKNRIISSSNIFPSSLSLSLYFYRRNLNLYSKRYSVTRIITKLVEIARKI